MHTIRLRGPWQLEPVHRWVRRADGGYDAICDNLPAATKATMPADWSESFGADFLAACGIRGTLISPPDLNQTTRCFWSSSRRGHARGCGSTGRFSVM